MGLGKVKRRGTALILALLFLLAAGCAPAETPGGGDASGEVMDHSGLPPGPHGQDVPSGTDAGAANEDGGETEAGQNTTDAGTAPDSGQTSDTGVPPGEDVGAPERGSLRDKLFIPLIIGAAVLLAAVIWLLWDRQRKRKLPPALPREGQESRVPITRAPGARPVYQVGNLHNIGRREEQQDSFCLSDFRDESALSQKGLMAVVADGMGGLESGAAVSQLVTDTFLTRYRQLAVPDPDAFLYESAAASEQAVEAYMRRTGSNSGSTLVAVLLRGNQMHFISVGDSRIYLLRGEKLLQINREHTYGALLLERAARGEVDPEEPYVNPRRHALTAYIGMGSLNQVERNSVPLTLQPGDKVILCSDGVFNALGDDALRGALAGEALEAAQRLEQAILAQNLPNQDNFTAVVVEWRRGSV